MAPGHVSDSCHYTAFSMRGHGHLEYLRMPFGLKTAPATFIRAMDIIYHGADQLIIFFDDVNHGNCAWIGHLEDWRDCCKRALAHNLRFSPIKTLVGFDMVVRLGYLVDESGMQADPEKVEAIRAILRPTDVTSIKSFLGLAGFS